MFKSFEQANKSIEMFPGDLNVISPYLYLSWKTDPNNMQQANGDPSDRTRRLNRMLLNSELHGSLS
jgi:hypothetical protein